MTKTTMLYKHPGKHDIHGDKFDYVVVPSQDVDSFVDDGWFKTTADAIIGKKPKKKKAKAKK